MFFTNACWLTCISGQTAWLFFFFCFSSPTLTVYTSLFLHQAHSEEISRDRNERQRLERDLEEASRRLAMAHQDIRRLTNELDEARNNNQNTSGMLHQLDQRFMFSMPYLTLYTLYSVILHQHCNI